MKPLICSGKAHLSILLEDAYYGHREYFPQPAAQMLCIPDDLSDQLLRAHYIFSDDD